MAAVIVGDLAQIDFRALGLVAVHLAPLAEPGALVIAVPEAPVEDRGEALLERGAQLRREAARFDGVGGLAVGLRDRLHVFGAAGASFNLEDRGPGVGHLVEELDGAQVFGRHDVLVVDEQLPARFQVGHLIAAPAHLVAVATVGRSVVFVERQIAFARDGHAERAVAEHFDLHRTARRSADALAGDSFGNGAHLMQVEFAGQDHHVGELAVEAQTLHVRHAELRGDVHFQTEPPRLGDSGHVGSDDGADACLPCREQRFTHGGEVFVIEGDVEGQVGAYAVRAADRADLWEVFRGEIVGGM